jgi:hypothetical protein
MRLEGPADGFSGQIYCSVLDIAGKYLLLILKPYFSTTLDAKW